MLAVPILTPVTVGCVGGEVCPACTVTVAGEMLTFALSLLARVIVTGPAAGCGSVTAICAV
jgi:hypothetical protein